MARLLFTNHSLTGQIYELVLERTTLGRGDQNTVVIHDDSVSSNHCEILMNGSEIIVRDLKSRNGTFVRGVRLNSQSQLRSGDTVRFGTIEARLELDQRTPRSEDTEITAVYQHSRVVRDHRRAQPQPAPAAPVHIESDSHPGSEDHTTVLRRPNPPEPAAAPFESTPVESARRSAPTSQIKWALLAMIALVVLGVLFWWLRSRK